MSLGDKDDDETSVLVENDKDEVVVIEDDEDDKKGGKKETKGEVDDERLGADPDAPTEEEQEAKRAARRAKRQRQKEWRERDRKELEFLHEQNAELLERLGKVEKGQDKVGAQTQLTRIETARAQLQAQLKEVDDIIEAGVTASDGAEVRRATGIRDEIRDRMFKLDRAKESITSTVKKTGDEDERGSGGDEPDLRKRQKTAIQNAQIFRSRNPWFDGKSEDSAVAVRLERKIRAEGFEADKVDFWQELEARLQKALPDRFKDRKDEDLDDEDDDLDDEKDVKDTKDSKAKGGPAIGRVAGGKEGVNGKGKTTYRISAARKQAMVDRGIWDDIPHRNRMIKKYAEYDKKHGIKN